MILLMCHYSQESRPLKIHHEKLLISFPHVFFNPSDCLCDIYGTVNPNVCDVEVAQRCTCKEGHTGADCSHCLDDFYRPSQEEVCKACKCNSQGSDSTCDRYEIRRFIDSRLNLILNRGMVILS